jgi:hypothetical protein
VVPPAAGRSLWLSAAWTGLGPAVLGAVLGIAGVAICWLPASGASGNAGSAIRAGVLTFLAALHGGITVDGVPAQFVPLGLTALVGLICWRAGTGLADASGDSGEHPRPRLLQAAAVQAAVFALTCAIAAALARLGTSAVSPVAAGLAGLLLFAATGTVAFVRASGVLAGRLPAELLVVGRAAAAVLLTYLGVGALLVAGSLVLHRDRVELLSQQVGGGWSGAPVLLLGVLAAPNAAVAGAAYLAGPGFALGSGSDMSLGSSVHGTLPAFPVLGAVPTGPAGTGAWLLVAAAPLAAGLAAVRVVRAGAAARDAWRRLGGTLLATVVLGIVLAWLAGGGIGSGRLSAVGASPWQFGLVVAGGAGAVAGPCLAGLTAMAWWRRREEEDDEPSIGAALRAVPGLRRRDADDAGGTDQLAG